MDLRCHLFFFFFNDTATTEIYTLSLHDALPIYGGNIVVEATGPDGAIVNFTVSATDIVDGTATLGEDGVLIQDKDRKSTRLNSSHANISYAVFCLKKKKN